MSVLRKRTEEVTTSRDAVTSSPKVFILQEPLRRNKVSGELESVMDFEAVEEWGTPVICMPAGDIARAPYPAKEQLKECFRNFRDGDFVVGVGDTALIFLAGMVIADMNRGVCKFLRYDKNKRRYLQIEFDIHRRLGQ